MNANKECEVNIVKLFLSTKTAEIQAKNYEVKFLSEN